MLPAPFGFLIILIAAPLIWLGEKLFVRLMNCDVQQSTPQWLHSRVLVKQGRRGSRDRLVGWRGTVTTVHDDGSLGVSFVIPVGGGTEGYDYMPDDLVRLGMEVDFDPIHNCFGDDPLQRLRGVVHCPNCMRGNHCQGSSSGCPCLSQHEQEEN